jgi:hypothetical protein
MKSEFDHLDLELRSIPGVVAVGFDEEDDDLVVQVVVLSTVAGRDIRDRLRRSITSNARGTVHLEVVVDALARPATPPGAVPR